MKIDVNEDYKVTTDTMNVILHQRYFSEVKNEDGEVIGTTPNWKVVGYFGTVKRALKNLLDIELMNADIEGIEAIIDKIDEYIQVVDRVNI